MKLYKINNTIFPNVDFAFTLTTTNMHLAPEVHTHTIAKVSGLSTSLAAKSPVGHTHTRVFPLYSTTPQEGTEIVTITATAVSGPNAPTVVANGNTLTIGYISPQTNKPLGVLEKNPLAENNMVQLFGGYVGIITDDQVSTLVLEDNVNA